MNRRTRFRRCASHLPRVAAPAFSARPSCGFTLLEMCIVLFIIALLATLTVPAIQSAINEQAVRGDAGQLALMVRTAMIQSGEQHRAYVIDLTPTTMALHPAGEAAETPPISPSSDEEDSATASPAMADVTLSCQLTGANKLLAPDPEKPKAWIDMPATSWVFQPGELCAATRVRLLRQESWLEISFNVLTGNVEDESSYFP